MPLFPDFVLCFSTLSTIPVLVFLLTLFLLVCVISEAELSRVELPSTSASGAMQSDGGGENKNMFFLHITPGPSANLCNM